MANKDMVKGAEPYGRIYELTPYKAEGTIYPGDFVKKNAAGTVEQAAAGDRLLGVAMNYAAAAAEVLVADHPDQKFTIQGDDATIDAQTDIGLCADIVVASGNATYKRSGMELDASSVATGTAQLKILGIDRSVDNALGANCKVVVRINEHQLADSVDGV
jgi:hypothetical protein